MRRVSPLCAAFCPDSECVCGTMGKANVAPTKDEKYAHYSWISGRCRPTHTDERKHKVTEKGRLPLQRSPGVVSCRAIVSVFESPKKAVNSQKILGVLIMILGAAAIKLL